MNNIKNKVVIITGASKGGIGEATAYRLAKDGAKLVLGARREAKLQKQLSKRLKLQAVKPSIASLMW